MNESEIFKASLSKSMALCSKREYCPEDIRVRLREWGQNEQGIRKIIEILISEKFIDEIRYSRAFARDKFNYNKWGKLKISAALRMKKIPSGIISDALESIDNELYLNTLKNLILSHRKTVKAKNQYDLKGKLMRYALSKGFENGLVYDILNMEE